MARGNTNHHQPLNLIEKKQSSTGMTQVKASSDTTTTRPNKEEPQINDYGAGNKVEEGDRNKEASIEPRRVEFSRDNARSTLSPRESNLLSANNNANQ
jgi:hypothetical protein